MAGLYIYAIAGSSVRPHGTGVFGRRLKAVAAGPLHAIVEPAAKAPRADVARITAQGRVIARLVADGVDVLPARFGTYVSDQAELRRLIDAHRARLSRALRRVKGRVQMTVQIRLEIPGPPDRPGRASGSGGTGYLRGRAAHARARRNAPLLRSIESAVKPYARASETDWRDGPDAMARVHHLVARRRVGAYVKALERVIREHPADVAMSGPWAPFAFVEIA